MSFRTHLMLLVMLMVALLSIEPTFAGSFIDQFYDPVDGQFDMSEWLLNHKGFLPVPIVVTEPAVGYGGGAALLFFHKSVDEKIAQMQMISDEEEAAGVKKKLLPPSISGGYGLATQNGTWSAGGFHFGSMMGDNLRYLGVLAKNSVTIKYYGRDENSPLSSGLEYNMDGWLTLHDLSFRLGQSNAFFGGRVAYFDALGQFDAGDPPAGVEKWELDLKNLGLGFTLEYDSRDNVFMPSSGVNAKAVTLFINGNSPGDDNREYQLTDLLGIWFKQLSPNFSFGWRVEANLSSGEVPFYGLPYVDLRGVPINRYQGSHALQTELEGKWDVTDRWSLIPFGGVGSTTDSLDSIGGNERYWAGGLGVRYLIARKMRLYSGVDVARGPEDWALYFQVGTGL